MEPRDPAVDPADTAGDDLHTVAVRISTLMSRGWSTSAARHALMALSFATLQQHDDLVAFAARALSEGKPEPIGHLTHEQMETRGKALLAARGILLAGDPASMGLEADARDAAADALLGDSLRSALVAAADRAGRADDQPPGPHLDTGPGSRLH
jgi:hypothetical protein